MKLIHVASGPANGRVWTEPFRRKLAKLGEFEIIENGAGLDEAQLLSKLRTADVLLGAWGSLRLPEVLGADPGKVRYLCCVTGGVRGFVSPTHIDAGLPVTNWGDQSAHPIAEGAMCLLLAVLKGLHANIVSVRSGGGVDTLHRGGGTLRGLNLGIYGFGAIGRRFAELVRPFGCVLRVFDPFVSDFPDYVTPVASLDALFRQSEAVSIHAGLTAETRGTVTAGLLALLPRHGILINTARGDIVDQDALFRELASGRLRAGLDVLSEPERLSANHPARQWPNLIWTCHDIEREWPTDSESPQKLHAMHDICLDNLRRFRDGQPLRFVMDRRRFELST
ncbi:MAG: NAD(P)-dependent oxidoreductase [bacterium]